METIKRMMGRKWKNFETGNMRKMTLSVRMYYESEVNMTISEWSHFKMCIFSKMNNRVFGMEYG